MTYLAVLGGLELRTDGGASLYGVESQPKRLGLLVYLALAEPRGAHRRDTLVALLWPELAHAPGRAALRQAIYHLRRAIGTGAIATRGAQDVELNDRALRCDALDFEDAMNGGHSELALALYRGDLLDGFFLRAAPMFEDWLERRRAALRARAAAGAWLLAEQCEREGEPACAITWGERALALSGDDELVLRHLLALVERVGDRAAAGRIYAAFTRRLRREYDVEPSRETRAVIERLRW